MSLETEVKIRVDEASLPLIRSRLLEIGAETGSERAHEENLLFDFPDSRLEREGCVLRLRAYHQEHLLTFKGKARENSRLKEREETETRVSDGSAARQLLSALGLEASFRYAQFREIFQLGLLREKVVVCLDETPVGTFVEIEGSAGAIDEVASLFGWTSDSFVRTNYVQLYEEGTEGPHNEEDTQGIGSSQPCRG